MFKKLLFIYIIFIIINNIIKFWRFEYLNYLIDSRDTNFKRIRHAICHLLLPSFAYKKKHGFYSLLFNFIMNEWYINRNKRNLGLGRKMAKNIIKSYKILHLNEKVLKTYIKLFNKLNIKYKIYNNIFGIFVIKET